MVLPKRDDKKGKRTGVKILIYTHPFEPGSFRRHGYVWSSGCQIIGSEPCMQPEKFWQLMWHADEICAE